MKKKNTQTKPLYTINKADGSLDFTDEESIIIDRYKPKTLFEKPIVAYIVMFLCATLDFIMFKQLFGSFLYDNVLIQYLSILGMLVGFDLVPIYLGMKLREWHQGYNVNRLLIIALIIAFMLAFAVNIYLRIMAKDMVLPNLTDATGSIFGTVSTESTSNPLALPWAIATVCLPMVTSLGSLCISYAISNPLRDETEAAALDKYCREREKRKVEAVLTEYECDEDYLNRITAYDDDNYAQAREQALAQAILLCDYVRERLKEHLGDAAATNELSKPAIDKLYSDLADVKEEAKEILERSEKRSESFFLPEKGTAA